MTTPKPPIFPCIVRRKLKGGYNATIYARNGKIVYPNNNQQFRRWKDFRASLRGLYILVALLEEEMIPTYEFKRGKWVQL